LRNKKQDRCQRGRVCPLKFNSFLRSVILIDGGDGEQSQHKPMAPFSNGPYYSRSLVGSFIVAAGTPSSVREHIGSMILDALKTAALAVLVVVTLGVVPNRRWGATIAFAAGVAAAFVLHFVAP
jgi:hypothetical protein